MLRADIAIAGGGLAGSLAAAMLGRDGHDVVCIDPHDVYPVDFRCEKLEQGRVDLLRRAGLADAVMRAGTRTDTLWVARFGRLVDKMPFVQYGMAYDRLVNTVRAQIPAAVRQHRAKVAAMEPGENRQKLRLSDGSEVSARLAIVATGLDWSLRRSLGVQRSLVSACHSVTLGFDLARPDGGDFAFPALQYNPERVAHGVGYLTLFRIGTTMRANLFVYRPLRSPGVAAFRRDPDAALRHLMPGLERLIGPWAVQGPVRIWPTDLHDVQGHEQPGFVMVGDAFGTPCPATGTGTAKVFTDIDRLCGHHIPHWLATPGMGLDKIRAFYADPAKTGCDAGSASHAYRLRAISVDRGPYWTAQRWLRFGVRLGRWALRSPGRATRSRIAAVRSGLFSRPDPGGSGIRPAQGS